MSLQLLRPFPFSVALIKEFSQTISKLLVSDYDRSHLQVRLIVADHENSNQAIDRPVNVIKDHQKGDTMIGVPMRSFDEELEPGEYFLKANIN